MYKSLYRSYRPQKFNEILGQTNIVKTLENTIKTNNISHSYLFSGYSGVGKTTLARIFAKSINCTSENKPCLNCKTCNLIQKGTSVDVVEMDAASNNGVEQIRNLIENVQYPPVNCKYKVYIIDEVHMLTTSAFNALLKTLEEPPKNTIFILATTEEHKIPETILTRCQRYNFKKITINEITDLLEYICKKENKEYELKALELIAENSSGSVRKALSSLEKNINIDQKITLDTVVSLYGLIQKEDLLKLTSSLFKNNTQDLFEVFDKIKKLGSDYKRVLQEILELFKELIIFKSQYSEYNFRYLKETDNITNVEIDKIYKSVVKIQQALSEMKFTDNPKLLFEVYLIEILQQNNTHSIHNIKEVQKVEKVIEKVETPTEVSIKVEKTVEEKPVIEEKQKEIIEKEVVIEEKIEEKPIKEEEKNPIKEQKEEVVYKEKTTDNDFISEALQILSTAQKHLKSQLIFKIDQMEKDIANPKYTKYISIFNKATVGAANEKAIILVFEFKPSALILNEEVFKKGFNDFIKHFFGNNIFVLGLDKKTWEIVQEEYITKSNKYSKSQKLQESFQKFINQIDSETEEEKVNKEGQKVLDLFGDKVEFN